MTWTWMTKVMKTYNIYIGWDSKQQEASEVCEYSIRKHLRRNPEMYKIHHLKRGDLKQKGLYWEDEKTASTEFSYTRFLVPHLNNYEGLAMFVDSDFLFTTDLDYLFSKIEDHIDESAVWATQHQDYTPKLSTKFYGIEQKALPMKNWSSMMIFNCNHAHCRRLTPMSINNRTAQWLHRFEWTDKNNIGHVPFMWNWLIGEYPIEENENFPLPWGIHYTNGGPFNEVYGQDLEHVWLKYKEELDQKNKANWEDETILNRWE